MFHCNGWGMPFALAGMGVPQVVLRKVDGAEILRRVERARRDLDVRRAGGVERGARRRRDAGTARSPAGTGCGSSCAGAPPPTRTIARMRGRARLGVHPDLRPDRDLAAAHDQPDPAGWDELPAAGAGPPAVPGRRPRARRAARHLRQRRGAGPVQRRARAATGSSPRPPPTPWRTAGSTPATAAPSTTRATSIISDRTQGRDHHRRRERLVDRGRGRLFSHPAVAEVAVIGVPAREVGRDDQGAGRAGRRRVRRPRPS